MILKLRPVLPAALLFSLYTGFADGQTLSVAAFGAKADGILRTDGTMTSGSALLTSAAAAFNAADTGKYIQVIGAGPGGSSGTGSIAVNSAVLNSLSGGFNAGDIGRGIVVLGAGAGGGNLITTIAGYASAFSVTLNLPANRSVSGALYYYGAMTLEGTIKTVLGPTSVTLSTAAAATVSSATYAYGTNNQPAFQAAVDAAGQAGGATVEIPQPAACPARATCGYVLEATDQTTARAPGAVKIRYSKVSLAGQTGTANLFCRGAWAAYPTSAKYPGQNATIRGNCLALGDDGGPLGPAGESVSGVTISRVHLYGMTNGNTFNNSFSATDPPLTTTGDGWDITHKGIYMWEGGTFSNIVVDAVYIQDFKGENIFSGGSAVTGMVIRNSTMSNFNGDGISMLAADLQVINNTITNGSNAGVENATTGSGSAKLIQQVYSGNRISLMPREAFVIYGVGNTVPSGNVQIIGNFMDTIGEINGSAGQTGILVLAQSGDNNVAPANIAIAWNTCHDCRSFAILQSSGNTQVVANLMLMDKYKGYNFLTFMSTMHDFLIAANAGYAASAAKSLDSIYVLNPGYGSGDFNWNNVTVAANAWNFPGATNYTFYTRSPGWGLVTNKNIIWKGDLCVGCTYPDTDHGVVSVAGSPVIIPYGPEIHVIGTSAPATVATIDRSKEQDGSEIRIVNGGEYPLIFSKTDPSFQLAADVKLPPGGAATFHYNGGTGRFTPR